MTSETELMLAMRAANRVQDGEVVLQLALIGPWRWTKVKRGKSKFVDRLVEIVVGTVDSEIIHRDDRVVDGLVVDTHITKT